MKRKYFFGWENLKWLVVEVRNVYSNQPTFFSKKRIESSLAFMSGLWGMIYFLVKKVEVMTTTDLVLWSAVLFGMAGYTVSQIQKEKKPEPPKEE